MNFLAHLHLSGTSEKVLVGNFIGDFVKGRQAMAQFDPEIVKGIELHRAIDEFTDTHSIVQQSKNRLRPKYRHYSGVIVDVFYDHFLAKNWNQFSPHALHDFVDRAYQQLQQSKPVLPRDANIMLPYMIKGNWLVNYASIDGIHRALTGMSHRTPYESKMNEASVDLRERYKEFEEEFLSFFPELEQHCADFLNRKN
ncbi:MAG: ACP phosphodiesterase [Bacteroidota bacterium]